MAELVPSVLMHGQAIKLLRELIDAQKAGTMQDLPQAFEALTDVLQVVEDNAVQPLVEYDPIAETEPPLSAKINFFLRMASADVNLLNQQGDLLQAATMFTHNLVQTEIMRGKNDNARVNNKIKTLQMYSNGLDSHTITFGDTFKSLEFTDPSMTSRDDRLYLVGSGHVTLAPSGPLVNQVSNARVKILTDSSNGFLGNNHQVEKVERVTGKDVITLKAEMRPYRDLTALIDESPITWIEYEKYDLTEEQISAAGGLLRGGFYYRKRNSDGSIELVKWVGPPPKNTLKLALQLDLESVKEINSFEFVPFGLDDNKNHPFLIRKVQTSPNGTDWTELHPSKVWIGTDINLRSARSAGNVVTGAAAWAFETRSVRHIQIFLEQPRSLRVDLGHIYWETKNKSNRYTRVNGPLGTLFNPGKFNDNFAVEEKVQRREVLQADRWAIGIREIAAKQTNYVSAGTLVTERLYAGGLIDRVALHEAEFDVPPSYDDTKQWVKFFISPNDGADWYPISRIQDDYLGIPEQIAFNDPLPESFREPGVHYVKVNNPVTQVRLKIEMSRPEGTHQPSSETPAIDYNTTSPVLKSYMLKVRRR